jgi:hypothetical protein
MSSLLGRLVDYCIVHMLVEPALLEFGCSEGGDHVV